MVGVEARAEVGDAAAFRHLEVHLGGAQRISGAGEGEQADVHTRWMVASRSGLVWHEIALHPQILAHVDIHVLLPGLETGLGSLHPVTSRKDQDFLAGTEKKLILTASLQARVKKESF